MLRVAPDGRTVWVLTAGTRLNVVLDVDTMEQLNTAPAGRDPETSAFQPGGPYVLIAHIESDALVVLDQESGDPVTSIPLSASQGNVCFSPDGAYAYVTSPGRNEVVAIEMADLSIAGTIPTGVAPQGIVLLTAAQLGQAAAAYAGRRGLPASRRVAAPFK